jgi:hypothetical protein
VPPDAPSPKVLTKFDPIGWAFEYILGSTHLWLILTIVAYVELEGIGYERPVGWASLIALGLTALIRLAMRWGKGHPRRPLRTVGPLAEIFAKEGGAIQPPPALPTTGTFAQLCEREKQEQMEQEQQAQLPRMIRQQLIAHRLAFAVPVMFGAVAIDFWLQGDGLQAAYVAGAALLTVLMLIVFRPITPTPSTGARSI